MSTYLKRRMILRTLFITGLALALSACVHDTTLRTLDDKTIGKATVEFKGNSSGKLSLERNGLVYRGLWTVSKVDESNKIAKAYGLQRLSYKNYQRGLGVDLREGYSNLPSEQGDAMNCEFRYGDVSAKDSCKSDIDFFEFVAES